MSALNRVKGLILFSMKGADPEVKRGITKVLNSIDTDLDIYGYEPSSDTDKAFVELDLILVKLDENSNNKEEENGDITIKRIRGIPSEDTNEE